MVTTIKEANNISSLQELSSMIGLSGKTECMRYHLLGSCLSWNWLLVFSAIPLGIICTFYPRLPESPRWLVMVGREDDAIEVLKDVARINAAGTADGLSRVPEQFRLIMPKEDGDGGNLRDLFSPQLWLTTSLLWVIWATNVLTYYGIVLVIPMYFKDD